ncbi:hypothetical protein RRG08_042854 [Elysia crispata]|uniref:Uncharacterized protein n=1 Tax=Elysia crispata TaxID=231223 RepID=A0AAE1DZL9_9GAST|nr:hypothetical protein RRG08_042854 [Elysia crispata]
MFDETIFVGNWEISSQGDIFFERLEWLGVLSPDRRLVVKHVGITRCGQSLMLCMQRPKMYRQRKEAKSLNPWTNCLVSSAIVGDSGHSIVGDRVWSVTHVVHAEAKDGRTEERGEESESMDELSRQFCYSWGQWSFLQGVVSHSCCACRGQRWTDRGKRRRI